MYIPQHTASPAPPPGGPAPPPPLFAWKRYHGPPVLGRRQSMGSTARDTNVMIGIIVAILLSAFIAGVGYFMYRYRESIRFSPRRRRVHSRRRKSTGSREISPPPPPPPQPPE